MPPGPLGEPLLLTLPDDPAPPGGGSRGNSSVSGRGARGGVEVHQPARSNRSGTGGSGAGSLGKRSYLGGAHDELSQQTHIISFAANLLLLFVKIWVYAVSNSMAVLASLVDSAVDLFAQGMLMVANRLTSHDDRVTYPAGRSRLEPVGVVACALLMAMASLQARGPVAAPLAPAPAPRDSPSPSSRPSPLPPPPLRAPLPTRRRASAQVTRDAVTELMEGRPRAVTMSASNTAFMGVTVVLKLVMYVWCKMVYTRTSNVTVDAVAQDNMNDVLSNSAVRRRPSRLPLPRLPPTPSVPRPRCPLPARRERG